MLNGKAVTFGFVGFNALNPGAGGVILEINPTNPVTRVILSAFGPQLYQGPAQSPELVAGEFPLRGNLLPSSGQFYNFSLIVTPDNSLGSPAAVPEPATWALQHTAG